jgi:hypothetical protein
MTSIEQLEALRRQVEEDYKLDMAAIDRLQRRFIDAISNGARLASASVEKQPAIEAQSATRVPVLESRAQQPDQLTDSLRSMFSNYR